jgi:adenylate cyclase class 2
MSKSKHVEIEGKILDVNLVKFKSRLKNIGATKVDDYYFKRYVFDVVPASSSKWVRLRTDGRNSPLTVKMIVSKEPRSGKRKSLILKKLY